MTAIMTPKKEKKKKFGGIMLPEIYNGVKTVYSINGAGKIGQIRAKK